jgi:hypothetical protein
VNQCMEYGGRSCLPLRDSSGFAPDSLIGDAVKPNTRARKTATRPADCGARGIQQATDNIRPEELMKLLSADI